MKTLILSCSTGEGHNSCAKAIKEVYDRHGDECVIADGLAFISDRASRVLSKGHVFVYRHIPRLFSWGYGFTEDHAAIFKEKSRVYSITSQVAPPEYTLLRVSGGAAKISLDKHGLQL